MGFTVKFSYIYMYIKYSLIIFTPFLSLILLPLLLSLFILHSSCLLLSLLFLYEPVSLIRVTPRSMGEGLYMGTYATY